MGRKSTLAIWAEIQREAADVVKTEEGQDVVDALICHVVIVSEYPRRVDCVAGCGGPEPHLHEYRASNIRPTTEATKRMQDPAR